MDRKVEEILNKEGGKVARKKAKRDQKVLFVKDLDNTSSKSKNLTMTGLIGPKG